MATNAWWSKEDDRMLGAIQKVGRPAVKRYRELVAKRYRRTPAEDTEMLELGRLVNKLDLAFRTILGKNPLKKLIAPE